jgi:hypothetical protein
MSVTVQWDNEDKTLVRYDFEGRWTWDEFYAAYEQGKKLTEAVPYKLFYILYPKDNTSQRYLPSNFLSHAVAINRQSDPNAGLTVIVSQSPFVHGLLSVLTTVMRFAGQRYATSRTLDEARAMLVKQPAER